MINPADMPRKPLNYERSMYDMNGAFTKLPAGAYVCKITDVTGDAEHQYIGAVVDICEGEYVNYFSGVHYADKQWMHTKRMYYSARSIGALRGDLMKISASNPGFDAEEAFWNDPNSLVGKLIGVEFVAEEYYARSKGTFEVGTPRPMYLATTEQARAGMPARPPRMMSTERKAQALQRAGIADWKGALDSIDAAAKMRQAIAETGGYEIRQGIGVVPASAPATPAAPVPATPVTPAAPATSAPAAPATPTPATPAPATQPTQRLAPSGWPEPPYGQPTDTSATVSTSSMIRPCPVVAATPKAGE